jgi:Alpha-1,6-glucosidases, pullulanase-type, C-terminal
MRIGDSLDRPKDPLYRSLLVAINASSDEITWPVAGGLLPSPDYKLHPIQENSSDNHYRTGRYDAPAQVFYLPGRSILVFTDPRD